MWLGFVFFFQAEDGIRDLVRSRGLGDVYKRQPDRLLDPIERVEGKGFRPIGWDAAYDRLICEIQRLSLIHI